MFNIRCVAAVTALAAGIAAPPNVDELVARAGAYVTAFGAEFMNVVAEEQYEQTERRSTVRDDSANQPIAGLRATRVDSFGSGSALTRRQLRSDFLLVKVPSESRWLPFRDVFAVDGKAIRDRQERLTRLFIQPADTALRQASAIANESARYNLGEVWRTINVPMLAMSFVDPINAARSRFRLVGPDRKAGRGVWQVEFDETASPTLIRGTGDRDARASGRIWLEEASGRIVRTELVVNDGEVKGKITTEYRHQPRFAVMIPSQMREEYTTADGATTITARATYKNFRRFTVTTTERIKDHQ